MFKMKADRVALVGSLALFAIGVGGSVLVELRPDSDRPSTAAVEDKAEEIATHCYNVVQPVSFPRISTIEERQILACAEGMLSSNYVAVDIKDDVRGYLYAELLPDGN